MMYGWRSRDYWYCFFLMLVVLGFVTSTALCHPKRRLFPAVKRTSVALRVDAAKPRNFKVIDIRDVNGKPVYSFGISSDGIGNGAISSIQVELLGIGSMAMSPNSKYEPDLLNPDRWGHGT